MKGTAYLGEDTMGHYKASAHNDAERHSRVSLASLIEIFCQGPGRSVSIIRLYGGTTPGRIAIARGQKFGVVAHDGYHNSVVQESAKDCSIDLSDEHDTRRDFDCTSYQIEHDLMHARPFSLTVLSLTVFVMTL